MLGLLTVMLLTTTCIAEGGAIKWGEGIFDWENIKKEINSPDYDDGKGRERRAKLRTLTNGKSTNCDTYCKNNLPHKYSRELAMGNCKSDCNNCQVALIRFNKEDEKKITDQQLLTCGKVSAQMTQGEKDYEKIQDEQKIKTTPARPSSPPPTTAYPARPSSSPPTTAYKG